MKKKIGIALAVFIGAFTMGLGIYHSSASQVEPKLSTEEIKQLVKDQYPGEITELELEKDRNKAVYEIEIQDGQKEYDIKLDGKNGEVLELEERMISNNEKQTKDDNDDDHNNADKVDDKNNNNNNKKNNNDDSNKDVAIKEEDDSTKDDKNNESKTDDDKATQKNESTPKIDITKAKDIALNELSGTIVNIELDEDDGQLLYEVEVKADKKEADIEIDAYTGEILVMEIDQNEDETDEADDTDDADDDE